MHTAPGGVTDIARVGSFRRIAKSLLCYTVHQMELVGARMAYFYSELVLFQANEGSKDAKFELENMLRDPLLPAEERCNVLAALEVATTHSKAFTPNPSSLI